MANAAASSSAFRSANLEPKLEPKSAEDAEMAKACKPKKSKARKIKKNNKLTEKRQQRKRLHQRQKAQARLDATHAAAVQRQADTAAKQEPCETSDGSSSPEPVVNNFEDL